MRRAQLGAWLGFSSSAVVACQGPVLLVSPNGEGSVVYDASDAVASDATAGDATEADGTESDSRIHDGDGRLDGIDSAPPGDALSEGTPLADDGAPDTSSPDGASRDAGAGDAWDAVAADSPAFEAAVDGAAPDTGPSGEGAYDAGWQALDAALGVATLELDGGASPVRCLQLSAQNLTIDPAAPSLFASLPATVPGLGNSVVRVDPSTLAVTGIVFVGSNPNALAVSDDGASLYVGEDGADSVRRVDLATGYVDAPIYLGVGVAGEGPRHAGQIRAVPGSATRYVVSRMVTGVDPAFAGLALYDGAVLLGEWNSAVGGESIAFASADTLYGYNNEDTMFDLYELTVSSSGFQIVGDTMNLVSGFDTQITSQGNWIFATNGQAIDGATGLPAGQYAASGSVWAGPSNVWFLEPSNPPVLAEFDRTTFLARASYTLPASLAADAPSSLVGWSPGGFAFLTPSAICAVTIPP